MLCLVGTCLLRAGVGSGPNIINIIRQQGFDERVAQLNGLFGAAVYFAEKSSKAVMPETIREQREREGTRSDGEGQFDMTREREGGSSEGDTEKEGGQRDKARVVRATQRKREDRVRKGESSEGDTEKERGHTHTGRE